MTFSTDIDYILEKVTSIDPKNYGRTRNYVDGAITYLSPYISRGIISTKYVYEQLKKRDFKWYEIEKLVQELAWRDYWQQVWIAKGEAIDNDLKHPQPSVENKAISSAIVANKTGISAIDNRIVDLYKTGYMHNHMRMYVASLATNIAKSHWKVPAQWMYYHLLDGDWASNALSWQWVAGANSNKKYIANQENINQFFYSDQTNTFLDVSYEELAESPIPEVLKRTIQPELNTNLPASDTLRIDSSYPTLLYNYYNLDPHWKKDMKANRILLLEPSFFKKYPVSKKCIDFILALKTNIPDIQIFVGEFSELMTVKNIYFKEHPTNQHYKGTEETRDWMFNVTGYYPSFFSFWKKCKKEIQF